ncbi:hypothetical protein P3S67_029289 [Capsicum chacoense]
MKSLSLITSLISIEDVVDPGITFNHEEKQMVEEKDIPFAQKILTDCEKGIEEEKRSIHEKYNKITIFYLTELKCQKKAKSDKEARYEKQIIEFRGRISRLKETKRKNNEGGKSPSSSWCNWSYLKRNNVESSQGEDRAIGLFADPKRVGTSTGNSSGQ